MIAPDVSRPLSVAFVVRGTPQGKLRARSTRKGRHYTPQATVDYEARIAKEWRATGCVWLGNGPVVARILAVHGRPASHFRVAGGLTAKGLREWQPLVKPDLDNLAKICLDSCNGLAYRDDAQVVSLTVGRRWADLGEDAHVVIQLWQRVPA